MGVLDKLMFWKKEPRLDIDPSLDMSQPPIGQNLGIDTTSGFSPQQQRDPFLDNSSSFQPSQPSFQQPSQQSFQQQGFGMQQHSEQPRIISESSPGFSNQNIQHDSYEKSLEIVSMKLDNLKVALENINQRLINIERMAIDSQRQEKQRPHW